MGARAGAAPSGRCGRSIKSLSAGSAASFRAAGREKAGTGAGGVAARRLALRHVMRHRAAAAAWTARPRWVWRSMAEQGPGNREAAPGPAGKEEAAAAPAPKKRRLAAGERYVPPPRKLSAGVSFGAEHFAETSYYFEGGLRKVRPYYFDFRTYCKGRWVGRSLLHVFSTEFRAQPLAYYRAAARAGRLRLNEEPVRDLDVVLKVGAPPPPRGWRCWVPLRVSACTKGLPTPPPSPVPWRVAAQAGLRLISVFLAE